MVPIILALAVGTVSLPLYAEPSSVFTNSIGMEMVLIQGGTFIMGTDKHYDSGVQEDESPPRTITISRPFHIGRYEVTQEQWVSVMGRNPSKFKGKNLPVESVSWDDAKDFIDRLNLREGVQTYRLPTEAEWEYVCRTGLSDRQAGYPERELTEIGWYRKNSDRRTQKVGELARSPWGVYDMLGNVREWVEDVYDRDYYKTVRGQWVDPVRHEAAVGEYEQDLYRLRTETTARDRVRKFKDSDQHVVRGGGWNHDPWLTRCASRGKAVHDARLADQGLRLAHSIQD